MGAWRWRAPIARTVNPSLVSTFSSKRHQDPPGEWAQLEDAEAHADRDSRRVLLGPRAHNAHFQGNAITTSKYNIVTFLPIFLFVMFSRVAYLYFLLQASLAWWAVVSPFTPYGPTIALVFVLLVAAGKAAAEDRKRHAEDRRTNNSAAHVVQADGGTRDCKWWEVRVGMLLEVRDGEDFPADLLCLHCASTNHVCYVKTTNLDGESNLKIRRPLDLKGGVVGSAAEAHALVGVLRCEPPNPNLHYFAGRFTYRAPGGSVAAVPVDMNGMLLRGTTLKNSGRIVGMVVYTGSESRIQMNAAPPPRKRGAFDTFLNVQITVVLAIQLVLCLACSLASLHWRQAQGFKRYHLALTNFSEGNYQSSAAYLGILFLTFWILLSYLVPISLFVTMEIVKFALCSVFIAFDPALREGKAGEQARARNSDIVEDLGLVEYVFSDKTGTLTSNEMQLRAVAVKDAAFGGLGTRLEDMPEGSAEANLAAFDGALAQAARALREHGFLPAAAAAGGSDAPTLALSSSSGNLQALEQSPGLRRMLHTPAADKPSPGAREARGAADADGGAGDDGAGGDGPPICQGPSPDEVALVEGARRLGFEFLARTRTHISLRMQGHKVDHEVLTTLDFTSERARMSTVARAPDGTLRLFCKGSDQAMLARLRRGTDADLLAATHAHLRRFSVQGLRTLVLASRVLREAEYDAWHGEYREAAGSLDDREARIAAVAERIERDLELVGITAIEDKLQEGVPDTIRLLIDAGMKVWMITGDKQETAINIAVACRLVHHADKLLVANEDGSPEAAQALLQDLIGEARRRNAAEGARAEMVIDGRTLGRVLGSAGEGALAELASLCGGVVVCRASPAQKAAIVRMMARHKQQHLQASAPATPLGRALRALLAPARAARRQVHGVRSRMLAIGDGANDVAMIQAADLGIGVMGKEGRQATNNADFAISQFRFLGRLLLVHGALADYRLGRLIKYSFYKNISFASMFFFFQFFNGWSGQAPLDGVTAAFYNAFFTSLPIGAFALFDRPVRQLGTLLAAPQAYNRKSPLTTRAFWKTGVLTAIVHASAVFFIPYLSLSNVRQRPLDDVNALGKTMFISMIGVVSLEVALISRFWTGWFIAAWALSWALCFPWLILLGTIYSAIRANDSTMIGTGRALLGAPIFWVEVLLVYMITFSLRFAERSARWLFFPNDDMVLAEREMELERRGTPLASDAPETELALRPAEGRADKEGWAEQHGGCHGAAAHGGNGKLNGI
ncbi:hypothetical protein WJX81_008363 [Elliptochloris bilobata]|uniref:Phospholipid-transporting ATPase n=1 Tax=Elliptochloris bilobata TaxID=381761 RepID=A0AAW1S1N1_9CHLO